MTGPPEDHQFPCDACGADMQFDPDGGGLICDQCGNQDSLAGDPLRATALRELDFEAAISAQLPEADIAETRVLSCANCGAQISFDANTHATECPFCATPVVTDTGQHRQIKPKGLLPFSLDETSARKAMTNWLGRLWFAPNGLQEYARKGRKMQGIYVPYWTYDAVTKSSYRGQRGTTYHETRTVTVNGKSQQRQVQKTRWSAASGRVARDFDDVLVLASTSLPKSYTNALQPWDLSPLEPYRPEFLAGFRAEAYSVDLKDGFLEARDFMDRRIERDVKFDIGGDRQKISNIDTAVSDVTFKHVLLPVWLAAYRYRGKSYRFVVNGRSARVQGERPYSAWKIAMTTVFVLFVAGAIGYYAATQG